MKKVIRLTERDLTRIVKKVLMEQSEGVNKQKFDDCVAKFVKPEGQDLESFFKRTDLENKNCLAIRNNLIKDDNLFTHNNHGLWKDGNGTKINVLTACFQSVPENENEGLSETDCEGNKPQGGGGVGRVWCFIDCFQKTW